MSRAPVALERRAAPAAARAATWAPRLLDRWAAWAIPVLPIPAALTLWAAVLPLVHVDRMTDVGLVSVLPAAFYVALALLTAGFVAALFREPIAERLLAAYAVALVVVIHATPAILYGTLRYAWSWKHVGIVDYIQRHGAVDRDLDVLTAYQDWPGFFSLGALVDGATGQASALGMAAWAPVFFELLFVGGVVLVAGTLTFDRRVVWTAALLFLFGNWVGQDYFSPQALSYFLFLAIVYVALRWFAVRGPTTRVPAGVGEGPPGLVARDVGRLLRPPGRRRWKAPLPAVTRNALAGGIALACAAVVASHQLTPLFLIAGLLALSLTRQVRLHGLVPLLAASTAGWVTLMARPFLDGNLYWIVQSLGSPGGNANETLINLADVSPGLAFVARIDRALSAALILLAGLGLLRRLRRRLLDLPAVLLAASPVAVLAATSYGGEVVFRIYFFALPFLAVLGAYAFFPTPFAGRSRRTQAIVAAASVVLLAGLCVSYYGKERMHRFSKDETHASQVVYGGVARGSLLLSATYDYPWAWRDYEWYRYATLASEPAAVRRSLMRRPLRTMQGLLEPHARPGAYFFVTRSQEAAIDMTGVMPRGSLQRIEAALARSRSFSLVYDGRDARVFRFREPAG